MLYVATGKPAHLGCKFLLDVSVVNSPIVVELLVITVLFCVKTVITNNSTTIGLFTNDTSNKNLQPKWAGLPVAIYSICTPDDG